MNQGNDRALATGVGIGLALGAALGVAVGALTGDLALWLAVGAGAGLAMGAAAVLVLGWAAWWAAGVPALAFPADPVLLYARVLALLDVLLPFFPLTAFSGRRPWEASRPGWGLLAAATVALWLVPG